MRNVRTVRHSLDNRHGSRPRIGRSRSADGARRRTRRARTTAVIVAVVGGIAGCGDGGDEATPTTPRPQLTAPEVTADETKPSPPASPTSSAGETTVDAASSSTTDPQAAVKEEVTAALSATHQAWATCLSQMPTCDTTALADTRIDEQLAFSQELATKWNTAGFRARNLESLTYKVENVSIDDAGNRAVVTECSTDGVVLFTALPDGTEQIVNDTWSSAREAWTMVRGDDGRWRAAGNETVTASVIGEVNNICA